METLDDDATVLRAHSTTLEDVYDSCVAAANETAPVMALHPAECLLLLSRCRFDPEQMQTDYYEDDAETGQMNGEKWKEELKLWDSTTHGYPAACAASETDDVTLAANTEPVECAICCTEGLQPGNAFAMCNDHWLCAECWKNNLTITAKESRSQTTVIRCYDPKCSAMMLPHHLSPTHTQHAALRAAISRKDYALYLRKTWFPQVQKAVEGRYQECYDGDCSGVFTVDKLPSDKKVNAQLECDSCHMSTCLRCLKVDHAPCHCEQQEEWDKYDQKHNMDAEWVVAHTKPCPQCKKPIEKNQGCNHMTCWQCKHQFCWLCMTEWSKHESDYFNCSRPKPANDEMSRAFQHSDAYTRTTRIYHGHFDSAIKDRKILDEVRRRVLRFEGEDISYLNETALVSRQCRNLLAHTYAWCFIEKDEKKKDLLQFNQASLFKATEDLSLIISAFVNPHQREMLRMRFGGNEPDRAQVRSSTEAAKRMIVTLRQAFV